MSGLDSRNRNHEPDRAKNREASFTETEVGMTIGPEVARARGNDAHHREREAAVQPAHPRLRDDAARDAHGAESELRRASGLEFWEKKKTRVRGKEKDRKIERGRERERERVSETWRLVLTTSSGHVIAEAKAPGVSSLGFWVWGGGCAV